MRYHVIPSFRLQIEQPRYLPAGPVLYPPVSFAGCLHTSWPTFSFVPRILQTFFIPGLLAGGPIIFASQGVFCSATTAITLLRPVKNKADVISMRAAIVMIKLS